MTVQSKEIPLFNYPTRPTPSPLLTAPILRCPLVIHADDLTIEVSDGVASGPHLRHARITDEGGRGLSIVSQSRTAGASGSRRPERR